MNEEDQKDVIALYLTVFGAILFVFGIPIPALGCAGRVS